MYTIYTYQCIKLIFSIYTARNNCLTNRIKATSLIGRYIYIMKLGCIIIRILPS